MERVEGYERLAEALDAAFERAAKGKGQQRHGHTGEGFLSQWIIQGALKHGPGALLFQIQKKLDEHAVVSFEQGQNELLDVIVYTAALFITRALGAVPSTKTTPAAPAAPELQGALGLHLLGTEALIAGALPQSRAQSLWPLQGFDLAPWPTQPAPKAPQSAAPLSAPLECRRKPTTAEPLEG